MRDFYPYMKSMLPHTRSIHQSELSFISNVGSFDEVSLSQTFSHFEMDLNDCIVCTHFVPSYHLKRSFTPSSPKLTKYFQLQRIYRSNGTFPCAIVNIRIHVNASFDKRSHNTEQLQHKKMHCSNNQYSTQLRKIITLYVQCYTT